MDSGSTNDALCLASTMTTIEGLSQADRVTNLAALETSRLKRSIDFSGRVYEKEGTMENEQVSLANTLFTDRPEADALPLGIPVWRAPTKGEGGCIILSKVLIGTWTHFFRGRTQPCLGDACAICADQITRRWHGWVVGWGSKDRSMRIVELPAGPAVTLSDFGKERGGLRGVGIRLSRRNGKPNGPVVIAISGAQIDSALLPPCPDLAPLLLRMWQIRGLKSIISIDDQARIYLADEGEYCDQLPA